MPSKIVAIATDPDGERVVLDEDGWAHVLSEHPEMDGHRVAVMLAVKHPSRRRPDPRPGRVRYYREGMGPSRWLLVVVDCSQTPCRVVTAFGLRRIR